MASKKGIISKHDEMEMRSLTHLFSTNDEFTESTKLVSRQYRRQQTSLLLALALCAAAAVFKNEVITTFVSQHDEDVFEKEPLKYSIPAVPELLDMLSLAKRDIDALLYQNYGEFAYMLFDKSVVADAFQSPSGASIERLRRRLKIKTIQAQLWRAGLIDVKSVDFTWVTGGHSAAAGHGNLFNQTSSSVMEVAARIVFSAVGIKFYGKSYAMGGTLSGPEVSMCMEAIFGLDVDVLSWDYGMTDGRKHWLYALWGQRAGVHPTKPLLVDLGDHSLLNQELEDSGMGTFRLNLEKVRKMIPDSENNPNLNELAPGLKYFKCSNSFENPDFCKEHKFDTSVCESVKYQTAWHNGWKDHLLIGMMETLFLVNNLLEAVAELEAPVELNTSMAKTMDGKNSLRWAQEIVQEKVVPSITSEYLAYLHSIEEKDRLAFYSSPVPTLIGFGDTGGVSLGAANFSVYQRSKSLCHTAQLPAETRFNGFVTQSGHKGTYEWGGYVSNYDTGTGYKKLPEPQPDNGTIPLILTYYEHYRQTCKVLLQNDYKDFFLVRGEDNWTADTVPNLVENKVYSTEQDQRERVGMVMMCTRGCDWGRCEDAGHVHIHELVPKNNYTANLTLIVNDEIVTGAIALDDRCYALENKNGLKFIPRDHGLFHIKLKVHGVARKLFLSSVVVM